MTVTYKIVILGDTKVGKTTYINRLVAGYFTGVPTSGVDMHSLVLNTDRGLIVINILDKNAMEDLSEDKNSVDESEDKSTDKNSVDKSEDKSCPNADAYIFMCSLDNKESIEKIPYIFRETYRDIAGRKVKSVIVGNKSDIKNTKNSLLLDRIIASDASCTHLGDPPIIHISTMTGKHIWEPIKYIIQTLTGKDIYLNLIGDSELTNISEL